jgi:hypothetical protein
MLIIKETVEEALILADEVLCMRILRDSLLEGLSLDDLSAVTGDVWETWSFNGDTFEPSVYSGFNFNSYAVDDGITYAAREEGVYLLSGTTDAGDEIHDGVILQPSLFGPLNRKRFRAGFFDVTGTAPVVRGQVGVLGSSILIVRGKAVFPRTLVGNKWTFLVAEFDELGKIELFPHILTR